MTITQDNEARLFAMVKQLADQHGWELSKRDPGPEEIEHDFMTIPGGETEKPDYTLCFSCGTQVTEMDEGQCPNPDCAWMLAKRDTGGIKDTFRRLAEIRRR